MSIATTTTPTTPPTYVKKNQMLPQHIFEAFEDIIDSETRDQLIRELRNQHWTLESIAAASHLTRERVRQIANSTPTTELVLNTGVSIPTPPLKPERVRPTYIEPTPETLARLLELQPLAQQVRSNGKKFRAEAEEYTALLNHAHVNEGVTLYRLAKRLGVTHGALRFRLVRYGYKKPINATSKVYNPILAENRVR
jgi:AraC-like DNA-binding protein